MRNLQLLGESCAHKRHNQQKADYVKQQTFEDCFTGKTMSKLDYAKVCCLIAQTKKKMNHFQNSKKRGC